MMDGDHASQSTSGRSALSFQSVLAAVSRWAKRHPLALDVTLALAFFAADLSEMRFFHSVLGPMGEIAPWSVIMAILITRAIALSMRRRFPLSVTILLSATLIVFPTNGLDWVLTPGAAPPPPPGGGNPGWWPTALSYTGILETYVAIYTVTALRGTRLGIVAGVWFNLAFILWMIPQFLAGGPSWLVFFWVPAGLAVYLGSVRRRLLATNAAIAERNEEIESGRERAARDAAQTERERVSADLQALVSRNLGRMMDESAAARDAIESQGGTETALEAIRIIERTGRMALADARRALGLLRDPRGPAPLSPSDLPTHDAGSQPDVETTTSSTAEATIDRPTPSARPDAKLALLMTALTVGMIGAGVTSFVPVWPHEALSVLTDPADVAAIILTTVPLAFRKVVPLPSAIAIALGFGLFGVAAHFSSLYAFIALLIAVYAVWAERGRAQGSVAFLAAGLAIAAARTTFAGFRFGLVTAYVPFLVGACAFGWQDRRLERARLRLVDQEAELSRLAEQDLVRARTQERLRIARELHDVTAHSLSVMTIQAGAARTVAPEQPEKASRALTAVEEAGARAQADLQSLFSRVGSEQVDAESPPGIAAIPELVSQMNAAGLEVDLTIAQDLPEISSGLELSLYRVVQEALTNVVKHAGPTRARVRVATDGSALVLDIEDEGPRGGERRVSDSPASQSGRGLIGMTERVHAYDGSIRARPRADAGGFLVRVSVPVSSLIAEV